MLTHPHSQLTPRHSPSCAHGFSLLELTLVLVIMGVLIAVVAVNVTGQSERAKIRATNVSLATIKNALSTYQLENNSYPTELTALVAGKFLEPGMSDGWKQPFVYDPRGPSKDEPYILGSSGPDLKQGNEDDISVWDIRK